MLIYYALNYASIFDGGLTWIYVCVCACEYLHAHAQTFLSVYNYVHTYHIIGKCQIILLIYETFENH